jgi:predicted transcriptional regulator
MLAKRHALKGGEAMTDSTLLKIAIVRSGLTVLALCEKCGFSTGYFYKCMRGEQDFRTSEVRQICEELGIGVDEMSRIFFAAGVDKMSRSTDTEKE